jgi:hypothetical protein
MSSGVVGKNEVSTVLTLSGKRTYSRIYELPHICIPLASKIFKISENGSVLQNRDKYHENLFINQSSKEISNKNNTVLSGVGGYVN